MAEDKTTERIKILAGIIIAVIGCIGSITAALLPSILPRVLPAPTKNVSNLPIVSDAQSTLITPISSPVLPTAGATETTVATQVPTNTFTPTSRPSDTNSRLLYVFGYRSNDKVVKSAVDACKSCLIVYLSKLTDLPDDWRLFTVNAKTNKGVPDACRSKQDLIAMRYTAFIANTLKSCP